MFKNYIKIAWRNLARHKGYSFLNIAGLSIGLAVCLMILILVRHELSYDRFHENKDRIYRIERQWTGPDGSVRGGFSTLAPGFVPYLEKEFPETEHVIRLMQLQQYGDTFVSIGEKRYQEKRFFMADGNIFEVFTLLLLQGSPKSALADPDSVVLSESMAQKYFGQENALGKILKIDGPSLSNVLFKVTGVMKDTPANSHVHFDFLGSMLTVKSLPGASDYFYGTQNLTDNVTYVYMRLAKGADAASLSARIPALLDRILGSRTDEAGRIVRGSQGNRLFLRKVTDIHLNSHYSKEIETNSDRKYITFFTVIALFILLIACINFTNLATARAAQRAREVGLRKVVGGHRRMLAIQFLSESLMVVLVSLAFALILVWLALPVFSAFSGRDLHFGVIIEPGAIVALAVVFLLTILVSGFYPAVYLSSFKPAAILRGEPTRGSGGARLRKALVVLQFAISVVLIVSVGVVGRQMQYLQNADLGLDRENIILLPADQEIRQKWPEVKQGLLRSPAVLAATLSKRAPSGSLLDAPGFAAEVNGKLVRNEFSMPHNRVEHDFFKTYAVRIIAGRDFSQEFPTDTTEAFILNETAVRRLGWAKPEDAVGQSMSVFAPNRKGRIIGVAADFNYESLHNEIKPIISYVLVGQANTMSIRIASGNPKNALDHIRSVWETFRPGYPFQFDFLGDRLNALYRNEERMMRMFGVSSVLAILIACLGLFGLASYSAEQRTREIGIRKILGASVSGLVVMFSREFAKWVLAANIVAWPVGYVLMDGWLKNFAYRVSIGWMLFAAAAGLTFAVALLTVISQSVRAALANPADSLRHE